MNNLIEKEAYRLSEFTAAYGISRTKTYEEIGLGRLKIFKVGSGTRVSREAAQSWLQLCEREAREQFMSNQLACEGSK